MVKLKTPLFPLMYKIKTKLTKQKKKKKIIILEKVSITKKQQKLQSHLIT